VALWAALTGGLHLDGLADCGDGLLAAVAPERRLEIMRDPRLGAFGGLSLVLFVIIKILAVASLPVARPWTALLAVGPLLLAPVVGRWLILLAARQPAARAGGLGQAFAAGLPPRSLLLAAVLPAALALLGGPRAGLAAGLACVVALAILRLARARLGGVTGDVFGLVVELAELTVLLTFAASASSNP
jgi:adenosylcobinamide-GDP ribazoletransferase